MVGTYEMAVLRFAAGKILIYIPGEKPIAATANEYIFEHGGKIDKSNTLWEAIPYLLADGWEPFASDQAQMYFKRKSKS